LGRNPYIKAEAPPPPRQRYRLLLRNTGQVFDVDPATLPDHEGQKGSVLSILLENGVEIDHSCGGVCACSTCHILVWKGMETAPEPIEEELDQLDFAPGVADHSRLSCQFVPDGRQDVEVEIPAWKRNEVSEGH
jgi:2Fe-2S ferredoxin